jgi:hypothetical protein
MKNFIALALLLALSATAQAKLAPFEPQRATIAPDDLTISTGPAAAALKQDYSRPPQPADAAGGVFLCRPQPRIFDKTRLAQSCH